MLPSAEIFEENRDVTELTLLNGWYEAARLHDRCRKSLEQNQ